MNIMCRSILAAALILVAAACGSLTGPEDDLVRHLVTIDESTIAVPDSTRLAVPFTVEFVVVGCNEAFDVVPDVEYYTGAQAVVVPTCVGDKDDRIIHSYDHVPSRSVQVELDFGAFAGEQLAYTEVYLVGENATFERAIRVAD